MERKRLFAYSCGPEERERYARYSEAYGFSVTCCAERPLPENAQLARGYDGVMIAAARVVDRGMIDAYCDGGVQVLVSRAIGVDNIDLDYAARRGLAVLRNTYSAASVADYAIMLMLMVTRHTKAALLRNVGQDYRYDGLRGRELHTMTVGIAGTGNIGAATARHLAGFGCRLLAWSRHPRLELADIVTYVDFDTLLRESDLLSLHLTAVPETRHILSRETIARMKPGAFLVNTARGELVDTAALIDALESGHLAGAALDVLEGDREVYYLDHKNQVIPHRERAILNAMPNVILTPHLAFWTDTVADDMVKNALEAVRRFFDGVDCPLRVV